MKITDFKTTIIINILVPIDNIKKINFKNITPCHLINLVT